MKNVTLITRLSMSTPTSMNLVFTFLLTLGAYMLQAQNFSWVNQIGGTLQQWSKSVTTDGNGNVYATGYFEGTVDFDPGPGTNNLTSLGGYDIFITKVSASGALIWAKQIGGSGSGTGDEGRGIAVGATGNVYVTGMFRGAVDFDPGEGVFYMTPLPQFSESCAMATDVFILKLSNSGDFIWAKQSGGNGFDEAASIAISNTEDVYVSGEYVSEQNVPVDFDPNAGTFYLTPFAGAAGFLLKLDINGDFQWAKQWHSSGISAGPCGSRDALFHPFSLSIDGSGNVLCTGDFGSTVDFDPDQGVYSIGTLSNAAFVMKLNNAGAFQWARALNNAGNHAYGKDVVSDANGNVYSVGAFDGTIDFDPGTGIKNLKAPGGSGSNGIGPSDAYVWVLNANGNYVWAGQLGGNTSDVATSIDLDGLGNMYVAGNFTGTADFNPGTAKNTLKAAGGFDVFVAKLAASGAYSWAVRMGGTSDENAAALDLDASGAILTTGTFQGTADFDPNSGTFNLTSSGGNDAFVHKMTQTAPPAFAAFETHSAEAGISLFPNPAVEKVTISFVTDQVSDYTVSLFDMSGRLVKKDQGISYRGVNTLDLQFGNIARGIYQLHFNMNNRLEVKLLLVE